MDKELYSDIETAIENFVANNYENSTVNIESIIEYDTGKYEAEIAISKEIEEEDASYFGNYNEFDETDFINDFTPVTDVYEGIDRFFDITTHITDIDKTYVRVKRRKGFVDASGEITIYMTLDMIERDE